MGVEITSLTTTVHTPKNILSTWIKISPLAKCFWGNKLNFVHGKNATESSSKHTDSKFQHDRRYNIQDHHWNLSTRRPKDLLQAWVHSTVLFILFLNHWAHIIRVKGSSWLQNIAKNKSWNVQLRRQISTSLKTCFCDI